MSRLLVFTLIASLGSGSAAFAGEGLVQSAFRHIQEAGPAPAAGVGTSVATNYRESAVITSQAAAWGKRSAGSTEALLGQEATLSRSGLKKRTKVIIFLAVGVGFAATAYTIDHKVVNVTPSSLGTRQDK